MSRLLNCTEARVLACLIEKEKLTPEVFPLTVNSIKLACNQKTSRDPVVELDEAEIEHALKGLRDQGIVMLRSGLGSRSAKYEHLAKSIYHINDEELAVLTVLLLRGEQTVGEIHTRIHRLANIEELSIVEKVLKSLSERPIPLVELQTRQPGQKENRFKQLIAEEWPQTNTRAIPFQELAQNIFVTKTDINSELKSEIEELRTSLQELRTEFETFKKQFEN